MIPMRRLLTHLLTGRRTMARAFPAGTLAAIESAIAASETHHNGEIRFVVEAALDGAPLFAGQSAHERALDLFAQLRVWDTEQNSGLLIYLLLADKAVEVVADRGLHAKVGAEAWQTICRDMEAAFRESHFEQGALQGVKAVTAHLATHFPAQAGNRNELPDPPVLL